MVFNESPQATIVLDSTESSQMLFDGTVMPTWLGTDIAMFIRLNIDTALDQWNSSSVLVIFDEHINAAWLWFSVLLGINIYPVLPNPHRLTALTEEVIFSR